VTPSELTVAHLDVSDFFYMSENKKLLKCNGDYSGLFKALQITQGTTLCIFFLD